MAVSHQAQLKLIASSEKAPPSNSNAITGKVVTFTQSQAALALSINRSKPADYCSQLKKRIKSSEAPVQGKHHYVDSAEFWKFHCQKLYDENRDLGDKVSNLELLIRPNDYREIAALIRANKRKAPVEDDSSDTLSAQDDHVDQDIDIIGDTSFPWDARLLPLLKLYHALYRLNQDDIVTIDALITTVESTLSYMTYAIRETYHIGSLSSSEGHDITTRRLSQMSRLIGAIYRMCLTSLAHLCRDENGRRSQGQIICMLVHFYAAVLDTLHKACVDSRQTISFVSIVALSKLLMSITRASGCEMAHAAHVQVFEGVCAALIDRVGGLMSQIIFDEHVASSSLPGHISRDQGPAITPLSEVSIKLEGRYLTWILQQLIDGREMEFFGHTTSMINKGRQDKDSVDEVLLTKAKKRLQETLLKGVFGDDGNEFLGALKMPAKGEDDCDKELSELAVRPQRGFVEAVWSTLGWDTILGDCEI
ncbi:MAG: hypothetical protein M1818_002602 [Claussenomyces sp. TS43310]|nr:MAG: hypothetical protein M1818_002602 [Claussenomyces sp. TS43310]